MNPNIKNTTFLEHINSTYNAKQFDNYKINSYNNAPDIKARVEKIYLTARQKKFNDIVKREINQLAQVAHAHNIKLVFIKGLILAELLYDKPEERFFFDVDILVKHNDLKSALEICNRLGYSSDSFGNDDMLGKAVEHHLNDTSHHFPKITKFLRHGSAEFEISIEIHTQVYAQYMHQIAAPDNTIVTNSVVDNSVLFSHSEYTNVYKLANYDEFLLLIMHATKDFFDVILTHLCHPVRPSYFHMKHLIDIDLYFNKYSLDFNVLLKRAIEWNIIPEVTLFLRVIATYNPNCIPISVVDEAYRLFGRKVGFIASYIHLFLKSFNAYEVLQKSSWELTTYILEKIEITHPLCTSYKRYDYKNLPKESRFSINEFSNNINNAFKTHYKGVHYKNNRRLDNCNDWRCDGATRWTDDFMFFHFHIKLDEFHFEDDLPHENNEADMLAFYFLNRNSKENSHCITNLEVHLCMETDSNLKSFGIPYIYCREHNPRTDTWAILDSSLYEYDFAIYENSYILDFGISWAWLNTFVFQNELILDIHAKDCDSKPPLYRTELVLADTMHYHGLRDISSFACIKIV